LETGLEGRFELRPFNVCSGVLHGSHEVARMVERICGMPLIASEPYPDDDVYGEISPGVLPSPQEFAWSPQTDLASGLAAQWAWAQTAAGRRYLLGRGAAA
jgi:hypothetical protein